MKKLKILTAICLTALLTAGVTKVSLSAAGQDGCTIFIESDKETAKPGETVKISVILEPGAHVSAITIDLLYDAECFEYQNDAAAGAALNVGMADINAGEKGKITLSFITMKSLFNKTEGTVLMTASFKALNSGGTFTLSPKTIGGDDEDCTDVTQNCVAKGKTIGGSGEPAEPDSPSDPDNPDNPAEPVHSDGPDVPAKPVKIDKTDDPSKPGEPDNHAVTVNPAKPGKNTETKGSDNQGKSANQGKPVPAADADGKNPSGNALIWILIAALIAAVGIGAYTRILRRKRGR